MSKTTSVAETGVRSVKSAGRTVELLEFLASRQARPPRLSEICQALDAPRSSVYALLRTLISLGWVQNDSSDGYSLGIRVLTTGTAYIDSDPYVRVVRPILADLAATLGETFHLGRIDNSQVVYLFTQESHREQRAYSRVGRRLPASTTALGKALLAHRSELIPNTLPRLTEYTIADPDELAADLALTLERGYAREAQENTLGLRCVAFALPYTSPVRDAISCSMPLARWSEEHEANIVETMRSAVMRIVESAPLDQ
ncbi:MULTISPECIES: IclR family transcriptional regulator [unclassified Actinobaculum]|uniref:IclR family transcriptional regulator n=1 Tax=unclassified Actinobaculum TaxID=2609299 RepID=UPI000D525B6D|nr:MULTISPECIES: IclR family transcriptional regulator [unclassified Actinobaculum]AWE41523.1 IclR family transcriptional regulator [Actinobaculum sp. 313]RTE48044.1 IclR family transcriptional regulator [Actinobaculum sp. 352]